MKPRPCRECRRPMEYGVLEWRCVNGDCEQCAEPVRDRKRFRRHGRLYVAGVRRTRMRAIRQAARLGIKRPLVLLPWEPGDRPWNIGVHSHWHADITLQPWRLNYGRKLIPFRLGAPHIDDGSGCLFCDKHCFCDHHEVPF